MGHIASNMSMIMNSYVKGKKSFLVWGYVLSFVWKGKQSETSVRAVSV